MSRSSSAVREWLFEPVCTESVRLASELARESAEIQRALARARAVSKEIMVEVARVEAAGEEGEKTIEPAGAPSPAKIEDAEAALARAEEWQALITRRVTRVGSLKAEAETCILRICRRYSQTVALYDELIAAISAARALVPAIDRRAEATLDAIADFGLELKENAEAVAEARDIGDSIALGFEVLRRELRNAQRRADIERARLRRVSREATINFDLRRRDFEKHPTEWHHRMQLAARHVESTSARIDAIVFRVGLELRRVACWVELPDQQHELEAVLEDVEGRYSEDVLAELDPVLRNRYNQSITRVHRLLRLSRSIPARFFQWLKK